MKEIKQSLRNLEVCLIILDNAKDIVSESRIDELRRQLGRAYESVDILENKRLTLTNIQLS